MNTDSPVQDRLLLEYGIVGESKHRLRGKESCGSLPNLDVLARHFHLPVARASTELGIGMVALKRAYRRVGLLRWPYRKPRAAAQMAGDLGAQASSDPEDYLKRDPVITSQPSLPSHVSRNEVVQPIPYQGVSVLLSTSQGTQLQLASSPTHITLHGGQPVLGSRYSDCSDPWHQGRTLSPSRPAQKAGAAHLRDIKRPGTTAAITATLNPSSTPNQGVVKTEQPPSKPPSPQWQQLLQGLQQGQKQWQQRLRQGQQQGQQRQEQWQQQLQQGQEQGQHGPRQGRQQGQGALQQEQRWQQSSGSRAGLQQAPTSLMPPRAAQSTSEAAALRQLARQLVEVPGLAGRLACAMVEVLQEKLYKGPDMPAD